MTPHSTQLVSHVSRIKSLDPILIDSIREELHQTETDWVAEYGEYQSGGWWTTSLMNASGEPTDVAIRDCVPVPTTLLKRCPATSALLESLRLPFMWIRLAKLDANSFLWEHRDYRSLDSVGRYRLHIPITTNDTAYLVIGGAKVYLGTGSIWRLTPTIPHAACNLLGPERIHLILDVYHNDQSVETDSMPRLYSDDFEYLPVLTAGQQERHLTEALKLLRFGYQQAAERYLLRLLYQYAMPPGHVYDLIIAAYRSAGHRHQADQWVLKKQGLLRLEPGDHYDVEPGGAPPRAYTVQVAR